MKLFPVLFIIVTISSCDPYQLVYINNYTESKINVEVWHKKPASDSESLKIHYSDSIPEKPKSVLRHNLTGTISVSKISDTSYMAELPAKSISQLSPLTIGFPIHTVIINGSSFTDTLFFNSRLKKHISIEKQKGLQKVNWSFYIYHYK